jgi:hypothetical protein
MAKYTVRTEQVDGGWVAHIDQDGNICIMQPNKPGLEGNFATEADAQTWANAHAAELETAYENAIAEAALKKEREEAAHQANLAMVAILERLTNPTA